MSIFKIKNINIFLVIHSNIGYLRKHILVGLFFFSDNQLLF